ncbi:hypothetical protein OHA79_23615 [Streptomyces sp. NBC_00841]|uniref:hypothetical protein n=1 Tax=unclassified Streptomyces TaxID=2593676 RepID=UPI0022583B1F|nr:MULTISPECIES: hypothetical protein [unclassified Streptomyces]MCX4534053.1 hypothetical protein [Streptomyces sp. NBC_01669]WSA04715.1 hypothetical protein OHA79_23615 [Streptomyces sp. NBC_00841]
MAPDQRERLVDGPVLLLGGASLLGRAGLCGGAGAHGNASLCGGAGALGARDLILRTSLTSRWGNPCNSGPPGSLSFSCDTGTRGSPVLIHCGGTAGRRSLRGGTYLP